MTINPLAIGGGVVAAAAVVGGGLYAGGVFTSSKTPQQGDGRGRKDETKWYSLSKDVGYEGKIKASQEYHGKLGEKYGRYFVGLSDNNNKWWEERFNEFFKEKKPSTGKFQSVNKPHGTENESLSKVCNDAYKSASADVLETIPEGQTDKFKEEEVWKFCSPGKIKIKTIQDANEMSDYSAANSYGGSSSNYKDKLVAAKDTNNVQWFWDLKTKELKSENSFSDGEGNKFKALKETLSKDTSKLKDGLRELCKEVYNQPSTPANAQYPEVEIFKFCSLSGTKPA